MPRIYNEFMQGSGQWYEIRSRIPTASEFGHILTPAKMQMANGRHKYAMRIVAARLLNWQADSLDRVEHIKTGKESEPLAIGQLEMIQGFETQPIGFVTTEDGRFGASPDRVVMKDGRIDVSVEAKCPTIPIQMERLLIGHGDDYKMQVSGQLLVTEADKAVFFSFNPRMPHYLVETGRDEEVIRKLRDALEQFSDELEAYTEKAKSLGMYQAFESVLTPAEIEVPTDADVQSAVDGKYNWAGD